MGAEREGLEVITEKDLEPGDVLLSRGETAKGGSLPFTVGDLERLLEQGKIPTLADLICLIDGGDYSHASLWDGSANVEATREGVKANPLSVDLELQEFVDVYRFVSDGHQIGEDGWPSRPVTDRAVYYAQHGYEYAYDELLLSGVVLLLSKRPKSVVMRVAVALLGNRLAQWIHENVTGAGKKTMVCTELVCTSYWEADSSDDRRYGLLVTIDGSRVATVHSGVVLGDSELGTQEGDEAEVAQAYDELLEDCRDLLPGIRPDLGPESIAFLERELEVSSRSPAAGRGIAFPAGGPVIPAGSVTPRQLQQSRSLEVVGTVRA